MSVTGLCEHCSAEAADSCTRCGSVVCADHYDEETGLCTDCIREMGGKPHDAEREPDRPDADDTLQF
ncbi:hypothetical protein [Halomarina oriensis]|uniref:HIT-type domain-containing protein n=1 Tax=Halomarina oriensis TaxID=671145 RepID=A0A6B0GLQ6_9EURY|nr:hypothetical protein [Halomarina oriensis]MWG35806.1 hypothetical protein [Halomarina oriensis]